MTAPTTPNARPHSDDQRRPRMLDVRPPTRGELETLGLEQLATISGGNFWEGAYWEGGVRYAPVGGMGVHKVWPSV